MEETSMDVDSSERDLVADGLLTVAETVAFLGICRSTIYALMASGRLPYAKFGRSRRIPRRAVIRLAANALEAPAP
jgi:excisionase family DNA binding protein